MIEEQMNEMAEAFLRWPLPDDVCADAVACKAGASHRTGTNLLTATQARAMFTHCLAVVRAHDSASPTALANSGPKERQEAFDALKEELDDALAELAALRADAERYRWLREKYTIVLLNGETEMRITHGPRASSKSGIDDVIDAARGDTSRGSAPCWGNDDKG